MHLSRTHAGADPQVADPQTVRANRLDLIERLADDLAHEIKNPLHSMVINLEVLKRRIGRPGGSPPDELLRYVGVLSGELDRVNRRIELLLRLVRPDRGTGEPTTLDRVLAELLELLEMERERRRISVHYEPSSIPVRGHLPLDPSRQLVLGLLVDTVELIPAGGGVTLRTQVDPPWSRLRIDGTAPGADATVDPAALQEELLSRLAVARSIADALGGQLEVNPTLAPDEPGRPEPIISLTLSLPLVVTSP